MNNIPQFLEHLPIWKVNSLDKVEYRLRNINKTCSGSCGQIMRMARKEPDAWIEDAIKLRKQGLKLSAIAE